MEIFYKIIKVFVTFDKFGSTFEWYFRFWLLVIMHYIIHTHSIHLKQYLLIKVLIMLKGNSDSL